MNEELVSKTQQRYIQLLAQSAQRYGRISYLAITKEFKLLQRWKREMSRALSDVRIIL